MTLAHLPSLPITRSGLGGRPGNLAQGHRRGVFSPYFLPRRPVAPFFEAGPKAGAPREANRFPSCKRFANGRFGLMIVLHRHDANDRERFSEKRTGLDHAGLMVANRAELEKWGDHLAAHGVKPSSEAAAPLTQSPISDEPYGSVLVFRDPDNIQLEMFAPPG